MSVRDKKHSQSNNEWYTPPRYAAMAREVFGGPIELDPASCEEANVFVGAERYYTIEDNGLLQRWQAKTLFLNAPGSLKRGQSGQAQWQASLLTALQCGEVEQAIMLVFHTSTETRWMQALFGKYPICFVAGRIKFIPANGLYENMDRNQPTHGNAFVYFGSRNKEFEVVFGKIGKVWNPCS